MLHRNTFFVFLLLTVCVYIPGIHVYAQKHDTLKDVRVLGKSTRGNGIKTNGFSAGQKITAIDSNVLKQYNTQSIATLLSQQTPVFIKMYSFNGLATLNFRGSSAAQSTVLWNGVPIQNAALGIADVSTLPVMLMNSVSLAYGSSAALYGSGNVGGALLLDNDRPNFDSNSRSLSLSCGAGSYAQYSSGIHASASGKKWFASLKGMAQTAQNDFNYTDLQGRTQKMLNSQLKSGSAILQVGVKTGTISILTLSAWLQLYDRQIPPAIFEYTSVKKQQDASARFLLNWERKTELNLLYAKAAFIRDYIHYDDQATETNTRSTTFQYFGELGWRKTLSASSQFLLFIPTQIAWIEAPFSTENKYQKRIAVAGAYTKKLLSDRFVLSLNARAEAVNNVQFALPGAGATYQVTNWFSLRANVQSSYRVPTLNELYYYPGGNTSLKPEYGWNEDAGYHVNIAKGSFRIQHDLSYFNRNIHDWIVWLGGSIWTPHNIAEVHSRGIETENRATYKLNNLTLHFGINTAYVLATTVNSYIPGDGSIGKQIPYTPRYNGQLNLGFTYKKLFLNYNHTYTGYRFTVVDESNYLLPYQTGNVQVMYSTKIKEHPIQLTGQCNNIWNSSYSVVAFRPLPGINWIAGLKLGIK